MQVSPYLFFNGRCEEAVNFYRDSVGAEVSLMMRNRDSPEPPPSGSWPAGTEEQILHCNLQIGTTMLMASDGCASDGPAFKGFSLSLDPPDEAEAARLFNALAEGGSVQMPLGKTFWSPCFGMLTDRFGLAWMINVQP